MDGLLAAASKASEAATKAAAQASSQAVAATRGTMDALATGESPARKKGDMDYFSNSKLFSAGDDADVEAGGAGGGDGGGGDSATTGAGWGSLLGGITGGGGGAESGGGGDADGGGADSGGGGMLGSTSSMLSSSMKSMGIGKKDDESALSVGRTTRMKYFVMLAFAAGFCFMVSFTFLPIIVIRPQKFALMFSLGSICSMGAIAMLKGPAEFMAAQFSQALLPFTAMYGVALVGTLYGALTSSYIFSVLFSAAQFAVLLWQFCGAVPGGRAQQVFLMTCGTVTKGMLYPITRMFK